MVRLGIVFAEKIDAVVISVRRSYNCMDVKIRWLFIGEEQSGVVIEFNKDYRTLYPVIKGTFFFKTTDPAKMRIIEMSLNLFQFCPSRAFRQGSDSMRSVKFRL